MPRGSLHETNLRGASIVQTYLGKADLRETILDAMNCQRDIGRRIIDKGGDYVFALEANQETLYDDVRLFSRDPETAFQIQTRHMERRFVAKRLLQI